MEKHKKYLVFTSAGDNSSVALWLEGQPEFDLCIVYYGESEGKYSELTDYYQQKGAKFPNIKDWHDEHPGFLERYDAVLVMDDDILIKTKQINHLFKVRAKRDLWLLQPAFHSCGRISHPITRANPKCLLRYTNFVEMGCPLFRTDKLIEFLEVFDSTILGWGTDYWYMSVLGSEVRGRVAIVDEVPCINPHTQSKPGGVREIDKLQSKDLRKLAWEKKAKELGLMEGGSKKVVYDTIKTPIWRRLGNFLMNKY